ncbi:MAG: RibD family protein [Verrucomicrobia bacterium]|nr:MAG: RibD family protein [Verrucomicrobiota bacterium]TAE88730.1 MAG: RibD family protein [Verrucomicrobiota bacterium]TAF26532.1 MAG: RibD family protein [Verrucomicrobiota bacterium]
MRVAVDLDREEIRAQSRSGMSSPHRMTRPQISINLAISADGKISSVARRPSGWTSREDHARLLALRAGADALLVGRGTLEADRMTLKAAGDPWRCVVSRSGAFDAGHPLFHSPGGPVHLLVTEGVGQEVVGAVMHRGNLAEFLGMLADEGIRRVHCEGGGQLVFALAEMDAIDELHLTWAGHRLFGGGEAPTLSGVPGAFLPASLAFDLVDFDPRPAIGECFLTYRRKTQ